MRDAPSRHGDAAATPDGLAYQLARHLASKAAAALAMAGQAYKPEVQPDEAYGALVRVLQSWVEQHVDLPEEEEAKGR